MKRGLLACALIAVLAAVTLLAQSTPSSTRVRTDANNYLITTGAAYTGPDSPPQNFLNARIRTDANNYLITTSSPSSNSFGYFADGANTGPSIAFASTPALGFFKNGATSIGMATSSGVTSVLLTSTDIRVINQGGALLLGTASDAGFTRVGAGQMSLFAVLFAALGTPANGSICYCSDCTIANPCAGSGTGAFAKRLNGVWVCN